MSVKKKKNLFVSAYLFKQLLFSLYWHIIVDIRANFLESRDHKFKCDLHNLLIQINYCCSFLLLISVCPQLTRSLYVQSQVFVSNCMSDLSRIMLYFRVITKANEELVHIYYSALNFRNVMTATGKLS